MRLREYIEAKQFKQKLDTAIKKLGAELKALLEALKNYLLSHAMNAARLKLAASLTKQYWLLIFYISTLVYFELVYRLWSFKSMSIDFVFPMIFALCSGAALYLLCCVFRETVNRAFVVALTILLTLGYGVQLIYFSVFRTPLSLYSLTGAEDVMQFQGIILSAIMKNSVGLLMLFAPLILLFVSRKKLTFFRINTRALYFLLAFCIVSHGASIGCVNLTGDKAVSQRTLYYNASSPELSVLKLGLLTTMGLDLKRLVLGIGQNTGAEEVLNVYTENEDEISIALPETFNTMNIDFDALIANEKNEGLLELHKYFSTAAPTKKNKYTGMFKGNNLILITAEGFSPYAISPELTPTLYEMSTEGFVFNNFYNPVWGVSTSDGEYVACTGLIPKSGVWSFAKSGNNQMPFVMGNQFKKLGYMTKAYHDHTYTYYKRNISHPNMGYDFKAVGNGLKIKETWPESDVEMIEATAEEYIGSQPFHTYYMTVSGHMLYDFNGNYIANKNKALVESLPYSDAGRAYIACNLELEFALKALVAKLEVAGVADKTVIALSADHYPYGLPRECIDELAGHKVEENFELYRSTFILWKKGMEPVIIDKPCSSLDINPTLSNLFGLQYDSRLLMGSDILSDASPLVIFSNRSWITDSAKYNSLTNTTTYIDDSKKDTSYVRKINKIIADKFKYSAKILEKDYYSKIISK